MKNVKIAKRVRRHVKIRTRVAGTASMPRLSVFKSNLYIYAQLINDDTNTTIASASSMKEKGAKVVAAEKVGAALAKTALTKGVKKVVFDRGGFKFTGRVKALAEGARKGGLEF